MMLVFDRITSQYREKIKKLRAEYKKVKDNNSQTGINRKTCMFYERLDNMFCHETSNSYQLIGVFQYKKTVQIVRKVMTILRIALSLYTSNNEQSSDLIEYREITK